MVEGDELVEFGRPVGPTAGVEGVRCRANDVMTTLRTDVGEDCSFEQEIRQSKLIMAYGEKRDLARDKGKRRRLNVPI